MTIARTILIATEVIADLPKIGRIHDKDSRYLINEHLVGLLEHLDCTIAVGCRDAIAAKE